MIKKEPMLILWERSVVNILLEGLLRGHYDLERGEHSDWREFC